MSTSTQGPCEGSEARRRWLLRNRAGEDCSIVGSSLRTQPATRAVSGHLGCVDRRLLLLPDGRIDRSKELRSGFWVLAGEGRGPG